MSDLFPMIARVESTNLGFGDHGIFGVNVIFDDGCGGVQGTGWYDLRGPQGSEFLRRLMRACCVDEWERMKGRTVYVLRDGDGFGAMIKGIRPLPFDKGEEFVFADAWKGEK